MRKKLKQKSFAAGVNRDDVYEGAEGLGVDLDAHIQVVIDALKPISAELGLHGVTRAPRGGVLTSQSKLASPKL